MVILIRRRQAEGGVEGVGGYRLKTRPPSHLQIKEWKEVCKIWEECSLMLEVCLLISGGYTYVGNNRRIIIIIGWIYIDLRYTRNTQGINRE